MPRRSGPTIPTRRVAPPSQGDILAEIQRDALGRVTNYKEHGGFPGSFERTGIAYDNGGRITHETSITIRRNAGSTGYDTYTTHMVNTYTGGLLTKQTQDT